jgi:hypothetical protein
MNERLKRGTEADRRGLYAATGVPDTRQHSMQGSPKRPRELYEQDFRNPEYGINKLRCGGGEPQSRKFPLLRVYLERGARYLVYPRCEFEVRSPPGRQNAMLFPRLGLMAWVSPRPAKVGGGHCC